MTLLQRALDGFLHFLGNLVEAVDTFVVVLGFLPPVVDDRGVTQPLGSRSVRNEVKCEPL